MKKSRQLASIAGSAHSMTCLGAHGHFMHISRKWQRVSQFNPDGSEGRPYWFNIDSGMTSWVPPPPPSIDKNGKPKDIEVLKEKRPHRKLLTASEALEEWPNEGFFVGPREELRCLFVILNTKKQVVFVLLMISLCIEVIIKI